MNNTSIAQHGRIFLLQVQINEERETEKERERERERERKDYRGQLSGSKDVFKNGSREQGQQDETGTASSTSVTVITMVIVMVKPQLLRLDNRSLPLRWQRMGRTTTH